MRFKNMLAATKALCVNALVGEGSTAEEAEAIWNANAAGALEASEAAFQTRLRAVENIQREGAALTLMQEWRTDMATWAVDNLAP